MFLVSIKSNSIDIKLYLLVPILHLIWKIIIEFSIFDLGLTILLGQIYMDNQVPLTVTNIIIGLLFPKVQERTLPKHMTEHISMNTRLYKQESNFS